MVSNYLNHHQEPLARAFNSIEGVEYFFIAMSKVTDDRIKLGYNEYDCDTYKYLINFNENKDRAIELINLADVVILGSAPYSLAESRLKNDKLTFIYTERIFKCLSQSLKLMITGRWYTLYKKTGEFKSAYALCASSYVKKDFLRIQTFNNKMFKWGYFPETLFNIEPITLSEKECIRLLWVGRLLPWKHPEYAIRVAEELSKHNTNFEMILIGTGPMEGKIRNLISSLELGDCCTLVGSMKPDQVRKQMMLADMFLFTSDKQEGWGAVLNEAMNGGCCVFANVKAGATNFLVQHEVNGLVFNTEQQLVDLVLDTIKNRNAITVYKEAAYRTIIGLWCAEIAAQRFVNTCNRIINKEIGIIYKTGPMSDA